MAVLQVKSQPIAFIPPDASDTWAATEFQLWDDAATHLLQTVSGTGTPPDTGNFTNIDDSLSYRWRCRWQGTNLGWGDWGDYCFVSPADAPAYILPPQMGMTLGKVTAFLLETSNGQQEDAQKIDFILTDLNGTEISSQTVTNSPWEWTPATIPASSVIKARWTGATLGTGQYGAISANN